MRKTLFLLSAILPMLYSLQEGDMCEEKENPKSKSDCNDRKIDEEYYKCCYVKYSMKLNGEKEDGEKCEAITKANYDRINDYISDEEKDGRDVEYDIKKYDCNSTYLLISIMSLIILLL